MTARIGCRQLAHQQHSFGNFHGTTREGLTLTDRRSMLKAGIAGIAGLSLPELLLVVDQRNLQSSLNPALLINSPPLAAPFSMNVATSSSSSSMSKPSFFSPDATV